MENFVHSWPFVHNTLRAWCNLACAVTIMTVLGFRVLLSLGR